MSELINKQGLTDSHLNSSLNFSSINNIPRELRPQLYDSEQGPGGRAGTNNIIDEILADARDVAPKEFNDEFSSCPDSVAYDHSRRPFLDASAANNDFEHDMGLTFSPV